jgi:hypothetical protein
MRATGINGFQNEIVLHHVYRVAVAVALGGLPLGGCTEKPDNRNLEQDLVFAAPDAPSQHIVQPAPRPIPATVRPPASKSVAHAAPEKPERKMAGVDPSTLVGLAPPAVGRILGKPAGIRAEAMTVEWTYVGQNCSLNIFFYPDIATSALRVLKYNIVDMKGRAGGGRACVNFLMIARSDEPD